MLSQEKKKYNKNISEEEGGFENILKLEIYCEIKKKIHSSGSPDFDKGF